MWEEVRRAHFGSSGSTISQSSVVYESSVSNLWAAKAGLSIKGRCLGWMRRAGSIWKDVSEGRGVRVDRR
jgi:hypothetical protein